MEDRRSEDDRPRESPRPAEAVATLADDEASFKRVVEAFRARDAARFDAELTRHHLRDRCRLICRWLCTKHCVLTCFKLCGPLRKQEEASISEIREFARVTARIAADDSLLRSFVEAVDHEDVAAFGRLIAEHKLQRFCHQLCHSLCAARCRLTRALLAPPPPFFP